MSHPLSGVRTRREMLDIPAKDCAKATGVVTRQYYLYENCTRSIYFHRAIALAKLLGCTLEQLGIEPSTDEQIEVMRDRIEAKRLGKTLAAYRDEKALEAKTLAAWDDDPQDAKQATNKAALEAEMIEMGLDPNDPHLSFTDEYGD